MGKVGVYLGILLVIVGFSSSGLAQKKKKRSRRFQRGIVKVEGAAVYSHPNFDAPVVAYLNSQAKVRISKKIYKGIGGFGSFFKVRIKKKKYGYVSDAEVIPQFKPSSKRKKRRASVLAKPENPEFDDAVDMAERRKPLLFSRFIGLAGGQVMYREKIAQVLESEAFTTVGLKMVGPGTLYDGPPLNVELLASLHVPTYYEKHKTGAISGFMTIGHIAIPLYIPFDHKNTTILLWGGVMGVYTKYSVPAGTVTPIDSQEIRAGLIGIVSGAHRFMKKYVIQADWKYYYEVEAYNGFSVSLGVEY